MSLLIERSLLDEHLKAFFNDYDEEAFILHTDIGGWGLIKGIRNRASLLEGYLEALLKASAGRPLLFPTFNYDYGRSRCFDVLTDKCQVGALNEHARQQKPAGRTQTPIFNFIELPKDNFSASPDVNPFGESSLWNTFCNYSGRMCFMGTGLEASTFIHYIEEIRNIGYRYIKPMPGQIVLGEIKKAIDFKFRVRPAASGAVDYDWQRIKEDLLRQSLLEEKPLGLGKVLSYSAPRVLEYWCSRISDNEFYFLTEDSKAKITELCLTKPYPFRLEDFEPEALIPS